MLCRVIVGLKEGVRDVLGEKIARKIRNELGMEVGDVRIVNVFTLEGVTQEQVDLALERAALHDPVLHEASLSPLARDFDWIIEVGFRPGVTDNEGRTARETLGVVLGLPKSEREGLKVYTSRQYLIQADLDQDGVHHIAKDLLANELIQRFEYKSAAQWAADPGFEPKAARVTGKASDEVAVVPLSTMSDEEMMDFSRANTLALSLKELHDIRAYYANPAVRAEREGLGMSADPTDAEIEVLAQTWSEHCKHKIFSAKIEYENTETGKTIELSSLYKTFIQGSTKQIRARNAATREGGDYCLSVFKDNAGVIAFSETSNVCVKMETHNSPSALDPYGGALTGIVGVNRDPMGTGMGANLCCATPTSSASPPRSTRASCRPGCCTRAGCSRACARALSTAATSPASPRSTGPSSLTSGTWANPLVYCGTIGTMPVTVAGRPSHEKQALPGDIIVMSGGRIGADGIHGATFSSEELHEGSPATAVQIGDPITQRKMYDFLMRARDLGLYNAITDNGAGGLSSSVGEMAEDSGGFDMDLKKAPLKYDGLRPWEILISEAQERMTMAVPTDKLDAFMRLSEEMDVESTALGVFNDSGKYLVRYGDRMVTCLDMDFLHNGVPQMELKAVWKRPEVASDPVPVAEDQNGLLKDMLGRLNICSKEYVVRQYDHEVQGKSAVKPMVGGGRRRPVRRGRHPPRVWLGPGIGGLPRHLPAVLGLRHLLDDGQRHRRGHPQRGGRGRRRELHGGRGQLLLVRPGPVRVHPGRPLQAGPAGPRQPGPGPLLPRLRRALRVRQGLHEERLQGRRPQDLHPPDRALFGHRRDPGREQVPDLGLQEAGRPHLRAGPDPRRTGRQRDRRPARLLKRQRAPGGPAVRQGAVRDGLPGGPGGAGLGLPRLLRRRPGRDPGRDVPRRQTGGGR